MSIKRIILYILGLSYTLFPYDLFPDFIAGWGWLDDLIILWLLWQMFSAARAKKRKHYSNQSGDRQTDGSFQKNSQRSSENAPEDPYDVLGLSPGASDDEIRQAYRRLANMYHPDKVLHLGEEFQRLAEQKFKKIQQSYQMLMERRDR